MSVKMKIVDNKEDEDLHSTVEILKLSASSMKTFDQCPLKYYYTYIEKVPRKQWDHFDLGNLCHKALEIFHETYINDGNKKGSLGKLMGYAFAEARKSFENVDNSIVAEAKSLVEDYLKAINNTGMPLVKGVETSFNFDVNDTIKLRGFLDRIDITKDGKFHIVDYKTTKNVKYLEPFQLLIYGMWLKREYPHIEDFKASYVLLRHKSKVQTYNFNLHDIEQAEKQVLDFASKIRISEKDNNWMPIPSPLCNWCDFKDICPTQKGW